MWGVMTWFAGHDQLGTFAKFNYRGESGYGTGFGGCCSLLVTFITTVFIFVMLYSFFF